METAILEIRDLRKRYGAFEAIRGISFSVQPGEMFGLLGPNGAGKTSLLSILAFLSDPSSGAVTIDGQALNRSHLALRPLVGIATQDLSLYLDLSARENLKFFGKLYGLRGQDLSQRIDEIIAHTGLQDKANQRVGTFSGGMKRRLNLGIAILHRPKILLLDEPTTGVDPQSRNHLFEWVRELNAQGMTIVYTSHYMEEVQTLCTRIGIMDAGELIACDTLPNLLKLLNGSIQLQFSSSPRPAIRWLESIPNVSTNEMSDNRLSITCPDAGELLSRIAHKLPEWGLDLQRVETTEPNLERVFLHLTHRTLRD